MSLVNTSCSQLTRTVFLPLLYILKTYFLPLPSSTYCTTLLTPPEVGENLMPSPFNNNV